MTHCFTPYYRLHFQWAESVTAAATAPAAVAVAAAVACQLQIDTVWVQYGARQPAAAPTRA